MSDRTMVLVSLSRSHPARWFAERMTELLNVLDVLGMLVKAEPRRADPLKRICAGPTISADDINAAAISEKALPTMKPARRMNTKRAHASCANDAGVRLENGGERSAMSKTGREAKSDPGPTARQCNQGLGS